ncbi:acyltransferase family protein [Belnapia rosea]|uniref:Surface polysaccharide O-acyltransferase, integral membrane enzyme n=1 Tax=Belnapia rosea TaxID=938405 RepID=A0A1G6V5F6_9PROT|nr:acyltransferase [Belnapia rosea]SDD48673.1 Surface polysaccharide O-acyltransferase, integral membrane enzyme [Belnapia rosea]
MTRMPKHPGAAAPSRDDEAVLNRLASAEWDRAPGAGGGPLGHAPNAADLSRTIEVARVLLVIGLVFLHYGAIPPGWVSPFRGVDPDAPHRVASFVNSAVLFFFFSAVPLLSTISGWLFFRFSEKRVWPALRRRIGARVRSLYAPLVVWNAVFLLALLALHATGEGASLLRQMNIDFDHADGMAYVNAVLGLTDHPVAFQFWFVRDLFLTALLSPLLWLSLRHSPWLGAIVLGGAWTMDWNLVVFFRADVPFFFYLGALARLRGYLPMPSGRATSALVAFYVGLVLLRASAPLLVDVDAPGTAWLLDFATRAMRPVGVLACWGVCLRIAAAPWSGAVARHSNFAFFLHATHYPLIAAVKLVLWHVLPAETDVWLLAHYAASVAVTVLLSFGAARLIAAVSPGLYTFLAGGRDIRVPSRA